MESLESLRATILVAHPDANVQDFFRTCLSSSGHSLRFAGTREEISQIARGGDTQILVTEAALEGWHVSELVRQARRHCPSLLLFLVIDPRSQGCLDPALRKAAFGFIEKPIDSAEVLHLLGRGLDRLKLEIENRQLREVINAYRSSDDSHPSLAPPTALGMALETVYNLTKADAVILYMRDGYSGHYEIRDVRLRLDVPLENLAGEPDIPVLEAAHARGEPVFAGNYRSDHFFRHAPAHGPVASYLSLPVKGRDRLFGFVNVYHFSPFPRITEAQRKMLAMLTHRAARAVENAMLFTNLEETFRQTIEGFARSLEAKDSYTAGHSERVKIFSSIILDGLKRTDVDRERIIEAALLHDIGKLCVDLSALNNPGRLLPEQVELFRSHPTFGKEILQPIGFLSDLVPMVYHHHENFDGSGYPVGLSGAEIPLGARIIAVGDSYDAMTSHRTYRRALGHESAIRELRKFAGTQFDPELVDLFSQQVEQHLSDTKILSLIQRE